MSKVLNSGIENLIVVSLVGTSFSLDALQLLVGTLLNVVGELHLPTIAPFDQSFSLQASQIPTQMTGVGRRRKLSCKRETRRRPVYCMGTERVRPTDKR